MATTDHTAPVATGKRPRRWHIPLLLAPAAIVIFIGSAVEALLGFNGPWVYAIFYLVFVGIHLAGVGEALKVMMVISGLAVFAIVATGVALIMHFDINNLFDIAMTDANGASEMLPLGWYGVWAALPFAMWLFLAVEGVPLAAEEAKDPGKDVPKGIIGAMVFLLFTALLVVVLVPGAAGAQRPHCAGRPSGGGRGLGQRRRG